MSKRILSFLLAFVMVVGMIPATAFGVFAAETDETVKSYEAMVAESITVDGSLTETGWLTSGKLSGGQAFDILWDGANLYFAVVAKETDTNLTVKVGDSQLLSADKAEGASAIEAKVAYTTKGVTKIENVTLSVGESTWTGNVSLAKFVRASKLPTASLATGGDYTATAYENGYAFDMPAVADNTTTDYRAFALQTSQTTLAQRSNGVRFEFDFDPTQLAAHSGAAQSASGWTANAGFNAVLIGPNKERIVVGIDNIEGTGLMFIIQTATWGQRATYNLGRTEEDGVFHMALEWAADGTVALYVDGAYQTSFADKQFVHSSEANANAIIVEARRYRGYNATPVNFKVYNMALSLPAAVEYPEDSDEGETVTATGTYDAFVASDITLDGNLNELAWRTGATLGKGQPFDILFDGNNLYFGVVASEGDKEMTVKLGDKVIATAALASGTAAFEAKAEYLTKDIEKLEDLTITVGTSAWTGDVNLVKMARVEDVLFSNLTDKGAQVAANASAASVAATADGKGIVFDLPAVDAANKKIDTLYAMKRTATGLVGRATDVAFEFTMDPEAFTVVPTGTVGGDNAVWAGFELILHDDAGQGIRLAIGNAGENGLFMNCVNKATVKGTIFLNKFPGDDPFAVKVLWKTDKSIEVFIDGVSVGTVASAEAAVADLSNNYKGTKNMVHLRATRYDYQYEYYKEDVKFTLSDIKLSKVAEVTYITDETLSDGDMTALFAGAEPVAGFSGWNSVTWENFANGEGKVAALVYNQKVYLAVNATGAVSATLGEETKTATADGLTVLSFDAATVTEYGQEIALNVSLDGNAVWAAEGKLVVGQAVADKYNALPGDKAVIKADVVTTSPEGIHIVTTDEKPMYDHKNCAYWIQNNVSGLVATAYNAEKDVLLEQTLKINALPLGDVTGGYQNDPPSPVNAWGLTIMFEAPSLSTSGKFDQFSNVIYADEDGKLYLSGLHADSTLLDPIALGKSLGDEFRLGLLYGLDNTTTVFVDGVKVGTYENTRYIGGTYKTHTILYKYMDPADQDEGKNADIVINNIALTNSGIIELVDLEDEITQSAIFGSLDLSNVTKNLPLSDTFQSAYLGEKALRWTSSNEDVIATDGTVTPSLVANKKVTLTVYLGDSETPLWSVEVMVPAASAALNALLSEEPVVVDGNLTEAAYLDWLTVSKELSGNMAAAWTKGYAFLAVYSKDAEALKLNFNGKEITVDLLSGTISGVTGATAAKNAKTGVVEIGIPLSAVGFNLTDYNQAATMTAQLVKGETTVALPMELLNFRGNIAELQAMANFTKDNGPWTLLTNSIGYKGTNPGKVTYVYKTNNNIDHTDLYIFSNEFQFDALPISDGAFTGAAYQGNGFFFYYGDEDSLSRKGKTIAGCIFTEDGTNLKLRISAGQGQEGHVIDLGKTLGEKFRITQYWYPNDDLALYVDGVLLATIENASLATSYLGVDVITFRYYSEKVSGDKVAFTLSNWTKLVTKYETVLDELTQNAVFGRVDLDHVQKDLPLVTTFASANFEALNLKWTSSDESVVATDGTITRHATEAKSSTITVYFVDEEGKETKLWDVTVTVDPMTVTKQPAPSIIHTSFAAPGSITVDGALTVDETWLFNGWVLDEKEQPVGYFGTQWDQENLYVVLNTEAETVKLSINGKTFDVTMNGNVTEVKYSFTELGLDKLTAYGKTMPITVTVGENSYTGTLKLTNVDFWGTDNTFAGLPMLANNVKSVKMGTTDQPDGNQGAKQLENGWRVFDIYGGADAANPAGIRTYVLFMKMPIYENFADRTEATHIEFDFYAKALPEWEWDEAIKNEVGRAFANYGVTFSMSDKADSAKNSNVAVFGIVNTADEGLVLVVNRGTEDYERFVLNKKVGEEFRIGMTWLTNANLVLTIDGVEITTIRDMSKFVNAVGDTSFVVNMLRNKVKPTSSADDMDVYLTNIGFGKAHSTEDVIRNLTFADFCGENETENEILSDLELPATMTNGQLDHQYPITWTSSDEATVDPDTGKVTRPAHGVKVVTLTAALDNNGTVETKEFTVIVMGLSVENGNAMIVKDDTTPFTKAACEYDGLIYNLDMTNNSIVYAFEEDAENTKINLVVLTDLDEISRLNRESLRLFVSDDNATYTEIEDYKLHNDGCNWYLYDFEADARYIKVHYTHRDRDDTNFANTPGEMIHVYWNDSLVVPEDAVEIAAPATTLRDQAAAIELPEGIKAEGLRVALNGEILFHYVDKDGTVYIRLADPTSAKLQLWNAEDIELADKENVYEVTYGTRETLPASGRWVLGMKADQTFPNGSKLDVDTLYHMSGKSVYASTDGGYTWNKVGAVSHDTSLSSGGWGIDSKTGRLFHEFYGPTTFVNADVTQSVSVTFVFYSDDGGKTWTKAEGLGKVEGDDQSNYVLSYTDLTELAGNDGEGPNVDFVFPMGAQYNNNGAFCGRVAYTTDGGKSWQYSESKITYGNETAFEGGVSEATILEREDGTLVYYARCQSSTVDNFTISYSLDHGVTWLTPGATSSIYTTNTQALMMTYDFDGFDGNRLTGSPIFMWGGNNVLGGNSYMRMPLNFAVSTNEMETWRNIQNIFSETFMEVYDYEADHYITNPSIQQINGDDMYMVFSRLRQGDSVYMVVNDFTDWFTRTKGAYDSFERGDGTYEGWIAAKGYAEASKDQASEGKYSLQIKENTQVTRSVPYLQNGKLSIDLYVDTNANFLFELQPAFSNVEMKCAVVSAKVNGTTMTFHDGTVLTLKEGWNTVSFDLELTENKASVSVNGGDAKALTVNEEFNGTTPHELGNYITYATIIASSNLYIDEFMVESALDAVVEATEADKTAANTVIEQIKEALNAPSETAVAAAKEAYNALTQVQKDLVNRRVRNGDATLANQPDALINYYDLLMQAEAVLDGGVSLKDINANGSVASGVTGITGDAVSSAAKNEQTTESLNDAAQTLIEIPEYTEVFQAAKNALGSEYDPSKLVEIEVRPALNMHVQEADATGMKVEINATYAQYAIQGNTVEKIPGTDGVLNTTGHAIIIKLPLPAGFVSSVDDKVLINHYDDEGNLKGTHEGTVSGNATDGFFVTFENSLGFSEFHLNNVTGVEEVEDLINAIGTVTVSKEAQIAAARAAYEALPDERKAFVTNLEALEAAEAALAGLKEAHISYATLSLKDYVRINFYMLLDETVAADEDAYMRFAQDKEGAVPVQVTDRRVVTSGGKTYYVYSYSVAAKEMGDEITAQFFYGNGKSTKQYTYSVKQYVEDVLASDDYETYTAELRTLLRDMLQYGAEAQKLFGYKTNELADAGVANIAPSELDSVTADTLKQYQPVTDLSALTNKGIALEGSLLLKDATVLRFSVLNASSLDQSKLTIKINGVAAEIKEDATGNRFYVDIPGIPAKNLDTQYAVTVIYDGVEGTMTYSPMSYCYQMVDNEQAGDLVKSLYLYHIAAKTYF